MIYIILFILLGFPIIITIYIYHFILNKIRIILGYKKYEYSKILSHGILDKYMWHKSDESALEHYKHFEFVREILPNIRSIKPKV
jgi:hypothetical protein